MRLVACALFVVGLLLSSEVDARDPVGFVSPAFNAQLDAPERCVVGAPCTVTFHVWLKSWKIVKNACKEIEGLLEWQQTSARNRPVFWSDTRSLSCTIGKANAQGGVYSVTFVPRGGGSEALVVARVHTPVTFVPPSRCFLSASIAIDPRPKS